MKIYDQKHIQNFYNAYGEQETLRWEKSLIEKVKYHMHLHFLHQNVNTNDAILELGAGTGVFTRELVKYSSDIIVTDLSQVQLSLNKERAVQENYADKIKAWNLTDICNLEAFTDNSFDKVVCYGGPLSYVFEHKRTALQEIKRVLKPNGIALLSVMNLWGSTHEYLNKIILPFPRKEIEKVIRTGNLHPSAFTDSDHHCHMFTSEEIRADVKEVGFELLAISASNCLSASRAKDLEEIIQDEEKWKFFLDLEVRACQSAGMVESGTHIIFVVKK